MTWVLVAVLAVIVLGALVLVFKVPRQGRGAVAAVLLLGLAGYAVQGSPSLKGAPKDTPPSFDGSGAAIVRARQNLAPDASGPNSWLVIGDALARNGQYGDAAGVLLGAVEQDEKNAEAWLALGNALVGHAEGMLTPASLHAFRKASAAAPDHPGPPFFLGLAMAQSGRLAEARALWADLLARTPKDAPWRNDLTAQLVKLDSFIASQGVAPPAQ